MTGSDRPVEIPPQLLAVTEAYRACELSTIGKTGAPVTWPAVTWRNPETGKFLLTTSVALPVKAFNIRRDPHVALLFSDPTGSGLTGEIEVLVQGVARCSDEVMTTPRGLESYWQRLWARQPSSRAYSSNPVFRRLMAWYYWRLRIEVEPVRVSSRPSPASSSPLALPQPPRQARDPFAETVRRLRAYPSVVLAWVEPDGFPCSRRVLPAAAPPNSLVVADGAEPLAAGPACLLGHSHDEKLAKLRSFVALGSLHRDGAQWLLTPERVIPGGSGNPIETVRMVRGLSRAANRYVQARGLPTPEVPWEEYLALKKSAAAAEGGTPGASPG